MLEEINQSSGKSAFFDNAACDMTQGATGVLPGSLQFVGVRISGEII
ncbi:MAG: hypothetical protein V4752_09760 [Pantoea dispersa]|nr:hypothetical protein [Pantoea sp. ICBG 985]